MTAVIGAEIFGVNLHEKLDNSEIHAIRQALLRWRVVFFRDQHIASAEQVAFARQFGEVTPAHPNGGNVDGYAEVKPVTFEQQKYSVGRPEDELEFQGDRARRWHTDITPMVNPALASVLRAVVIPPYGGDTLFTNLVAAYEGLSAPLRGMIDNLHAVHSFGGETRAFARRRASEDREPFSSVHPIVRVHPETGEKGLFVNPNFTRYVVGMPRREGDAILELLYAQLARHEYTVRFRWQLGSLAFWDNRSTAHLAAVDIDHAEYERYLERVTLVGDIPVGPDGYHSESIVGDFFGAA
jgi:taurine dioxygenase